MTEMERLEQLTKTLQEGKTLVHEQTNTKVKLVNGHIFKFYPDGAIVIGSAIYNSECWTIEEPEPRFKITENQLAEYECRDGSKAVCWGVVLGDKEHYTNVIQNTKGEPYSVLLNGKRYATQYSARDLVRKIRDL